MYKKVLIIKSPKYYQDSVEELRRVYNRLKLIMDGMPAIRFADAEVLRVLTTEKAYCNYNPDTGNVGLLILVDRDDDKMITEEEAKQVRSLSNRPDKNSSIFANNTKIETFDEFRHFAELDSISGGTFQGCTSLRRVSLPPNTTLGNTVFSRCGIERLMVPEGYLSIGTNLLDGSTNCRLVDFPTTVTSIGSGLLWRVKNITTIVCRAVVPPTFGGFGYDGIPVAIYVPDASVNTYKAATNWSSQSNKIFPLSTYKE